MYFIMESDSKSNLPVGHKPTRMDYTVAYTDQASTIDSLHGTGLATGQLTRAILVVNAQPREGGAKNKIRAASQLACYGYCWR